MAQPLDAKRFELAGEPFPVAEQGGGWNILKPGDPKMEIPG